MSVRLSWDAYAKKLKLLNVFTDNMAMTSEALLRNARKWCVELEMLPSLGLAKESTWLSVMIMRSNGCYSVRLSNVFEFLLDMQ